MTNKKVRYSNGVIIIDKSTDTLSIWGRDNPNVATLDILKEIIKKYYAALGHLAKCPENSKDIDCKMRSDCNQCWDRALTKGYSKEPNPTPITILDNSNFDESKFEDDRESILDNFIKMKV